MQNIIQQRKYFYIFSSLLILVCIFMLSVWGLKLGIDFRGGTLLEVSWSEGKILDRNAIEQTLYPLNVESLIIQATGEKNTLIRYVSSDEKLNELVLSELRKKDESLELIRSEFIGASVSDEIKHNAILALFFAVISIILYIAWAFRGVSKPISSWHYGVQATVALAHDIIITLGFFSFLGHFYNVEVGASFIAALLTILGYSVNDTIVVYDRVRENLLRLNVKESFEVTVNRSLNQTIARSFNTSFTVIFVLIALCIFGGESIRSFALALLVGVSAGTYSSIYVATALLVTSNEFVLKKMQQKKDEKEREDNEKENEEQKIKKEMKDKKDEKENRKESLEHSFSKDNLENKEKENSSYNIFEIDKKKQFKNKKKKKKQRIRR